ncbi:MAG: plasmid pRiA4b ORF-3 family protein [Phycisphaerae bacterium]|nr:plasmid pRiA4b ORF-3 family protein [Phycisphaerae bacterium]
MVSTYSQARAYVIKITLVGTKPSIWRRFCVPGEISLDRLHDIIQIVMGWQETHLHCFEIEGRRYAEELEDAGDDGEQEAKIRLSDLIVTEKAKFFYEYDFGDAWCHELQVERIDDIPKGHCLRVTCLDGKQSCPPEDVGGIDGFAEFLQAIRNARHPEHEAFREWAGEDFDPRHFDVDEVNIELAKYARWSRPRALEQDLQVPRI